MGKDNAKKAKYKKEMEEIKKLRYIGSIMKRSDIENALLSNPSNETESVNESHIDNMLEDLGEKSMKGEEEGLEAIEKMTQKGSSVVTKAKRPVRHAARAAKRRVQKRRTVVRAKRSVKIARGKAPKKRKR